MNLFPKKTKYNKFRKLPLVGITNHGNTIEFGSFGLQSIETARVTSRQIEAARKAINRKLRRAGKLWIRIFPDIPVSAKPTEVRMGKGKGSNEYWCSRVRTGKMLFELAGVPLELAKEAFLLGANKLTVKTKFIVK